MHVIYEALKKTGGKTDGEALIAAAKGMKWESPRGPMSIDPETRDIVQTVYIRKVEKAGNELRQCGVRQGRERERPGQGAYEELRTTLAAPTRGECHDRPIAGVLFDGFAYGMLLFLLSVGLSVTLGMMNFINLAHCAFAMLGGYVTVTLMQPARLAVSRDPAVRFPGGGGDQRRARAHALPPALPRERSRPGACSPSGSSSSRSRSTAYVYGTVQQPVQTPSCLRGSSLSWA